MRLWSKLMLSGRYRPSKLVQQSPQQRFWGPICPTKRAQLVLHAPPCVETHSCCHKMITQKHPKRPRVVGGQPEITTVQATHPGLKTAGVLTGWGSIRGPIWKTWGQHPGSGGDGDLSVQCGDTAPSFDYAFPVPLLDQQNSLVSFPPTHNHHPVLSSITGPETFKTQTPKRDLGGRGRVLPNNCFSGGYGQCEQTLHPEIWRMANREDQLCWHAVQCGNMEHIPAGQTCRVMAV